MLNERGTYESDLTVARIAEDRFLLVTGTAQATRDADWISRNLPADAHAYLTDVTSAYAVIAVMGPRARELLARLTKAQLDNAAFPFGADPRDRRSGPRPSSPRGALMSASSAGSFTCRPNSRRASTTR